MTFKKHLILLTLGLSAVAAFGLSQPVNAAVTIKKITPSQMAKIANSNDYYRVNKSTKVGPYKSQKVTLPKGTILSMTAGTDSASRAPGGKVLVANYDNNVDLSYALKKRLGVKHPSKRFQIWAPAYPGRFTKVKRPAYTLPYGQNVLYSGGLTAFKNLVTAGYHHGHPFNSNALKITSDGYLEFYKYAGTTLAGFDGRWRYTQKPTSYVKISHTLNKGATKYLYFQQPLKGVKTVHLHHQKYRYRLAIKNRHTPYIDGNNQFSASIYSAGGHRYFTSPRSYNVYGD
ncbi:hypothetical protein FEZ41_13455 [Lentilactobacillus parafarraginis]|jgi:hypothetical protein|uniref:Surface layer protein A domain-containing protein n=2 Tax=Lentilactobacillus parafarraginis TaxID=390842 RepID=A0A0R1YPA6_9LACO|nr:hypothetical protein [Lentilactobacillus parafarraginis]KRM44382.1 hypothetical protein FD47_GL000507 [Lentilactobacillus parafarraginis DSM 18390 = JCM 14109]TLQ15819.1 hypothetical protein FEZ41_13455 [Lentilactobacillus parafarraginis]